MKATWLGAARALRREISDVSTVQSMPAAARPVLAYSEDAASYNMLGGYLEHLLADYGCPVLYVTSDPDDPLLQEPRGMNVRYVRKLLPTFLPKVDSAVMLTTMPDLDKFHLKRPRGRTRLVYAFHSLNSIHEVYRECAFDVYDEFFCAGPHHRTELRAHFEAYGLPQPVLHDVGYPKLDRVAAAFDGYRKTDTSRPVVLLAPSWGRGNSLERAGVAIVESLLAIGARVIVRPHPCFFLPIYPEGAGAVSELQRRFGNNPLVTVETSIRSEESFFEADLMISDFSGAAFEYALGTLRPVLFVDVSRKTLNASWQRLGLPTFEDTMRSACGEIVSPDSLELVATAAKRLLQGGAQWRERLLALRATAVYNFAGSARVGAKILNDLAGRA